MAKRSTFMDSEGDVIAADSYRMECLLMRVFFENMDLYDEFPMIANEFLKHEFVNLDLYHDADYGVDTPKDAPKTLFLNMKILSLVYQGAKKGSEYSRNLLIYLYKTYYRQEYNALKRFRELNSADALELTKRSTDSSPYPVNWRLPRIFAMAPFLGVEFGDIEYAYSVMDETWKTMDRNKRSMLEFEFPADILDECREQVSDWLNEHNGRFDKKTMPRWWIARKLACASLQTFGYTQTYITGNEETADRAEEELNMVRTLALLKMNFRRKEFNFEDIQTLSVIYMFASKMTQEFSRINVALNDILGISSEYVLETPQRPRFQPEKVNGESGVSSIGPTDPAGSRGFSQDPGAASNVPLNTVLDTATNAMSDVSQQSMISTVPVEDASQREKRMHAEIERLRTRLHNAEQENIHLRETNNNLRGLSEDVKILKQQHEDDQKELHALREHVYRSTEGDVDTGAADIAEMEGLISGKKIVIIGGHENWLNKLKAKFNGWRFISTELSAVVDLRVFDGADYTYFFTEHLAHRTYGAYVKVLRERDLPFGYIHSTNIENNVRQIYEDISGS
ncbi:MAG: hypothetical protein LUI87_12760 [Lachnospiraceae bacterium]|nr:hypothetical protein [Lachnospiraceae bacterium]